MKRHLHSFAVVITAVLILSFASFPVVAQTSNALNFDGMNDYADVGGGPLITNTSYTKEAWIRISDASGTGANARNILSETNSSFFVYDDGKLAAGQSPSYTARVKDNTPLVVGQWYHVAVTYDLSNNTMTLYKSGVAVATNPSVPFLGTATGSTIGGIFYGGSYGFFFQGDIGEMRVWNYARSAAEIALTAHCRIPAGTDGLTAYYKFNDGVPGGDNTSITALNDASGNGHNATLNGFALTGSTSNFNDDLTTVSGECSVVPVGLTNFTARASDGIVLLSWQTSQEVNNRGFFVERSDNGNTNWEAIGFVAGNRNTSTVHDYKFTDAKPLGGQSYYRLQQVDHDGRSVYSSVAPVNMPDAGGVSIYPTAAAASVTIRISDRDLLGRPYVIYDHTGRMVKKGLVQSVTQTIDISSLFGGVYIVRIGNHQPMRFIKK